MESFSSTRINSIISLGLFCCNEFSLLNYYKVDTEDGRTSPFVIIEDDQVPELTSPKTVNNNSMGNNSSKSILFSLFERYTLNDLSFQLQKYLLE